MKNIRIFKYFALIIILSITITLLFSTDEVFAEEQIIQKKLLSEGLYPALFANGLWGYVDENDNTIIEPILTEAGYFIDGKAPVLIEQSSWMGSTWEWYIINQDGEILENLLSVDTSLYSSNEKLAVLNYINEFGKEIIYKNEQDFFSSLKSEIIVNNDKNSSENLIPYQSYNGLYGYKDSNGNIKLEPVYTLGLNFVDGKAPVLLNNNWVEITTTGDISRYFILDVSSKPQESARFSMLIVEVNNKKYLESKNMKYTPSWGVSLEDVEYLENNLYGTPVEIIPSGQVEQSSNINVTLDGKKVNFDVQPVIINNRTLVPLRAIFEGIGLEVVWDDSTKTVTGINDDVKITLQIDSKIASVNGNKINLDVSACIIDNRTFVPIRFVSESTGANVSWNANLSTVIINSANKTEFNNETNKSIEISIGASKDEKKGNILGNITNEGIAAADADWIFYTADNKLWKIKIDGTKKQKLDDTNANNINIIDEHIYYTVNDYNNTEIEGLYRMNLDGSNKEKIYDGNMDKVFINDYSIYYISGDDNFIYKMYTNLRGGSTLLKQNTSLYINIVEDEIYFINLDDPTVWTNFSFGHGKIYSMLSSGSVSSKLSDDVADRLIVDGEYIYYVNASDDNKIYRIMTDGSDKQKISDDECLGSMNVTNGWIYFASFDELENITLNKMRIDGSDKAKIVNARAKSINLIDEWIYYIDGNDGNNTFRIKTDGTQKELLN